jgi:hypothetical protein
MAKAISKKAAVKKAAPKKKKVESKTPVSKATGMRYQDKSAGQENLLPIFEEIKTLLLPYVKGSMKMLGGTGGEMAIVSEIPVEIAGRKRDELWFAGIIVQKGYVGFYYMPVYADPEMKSIFKPELLKCLKGKSCFHIKKYDKEIFSQIKSALKVGYDGYLEKGWITK